jgi:hypothetical protein
MRSPSLPVPERPRRPEWLTDRHVALVGDGWNARIDVEVRRADVGQTVDGFTTVFTAPTTWSSAQTTCSVVVAGQQR